MDDILEKVMNFINENTMLLILICIFLIIILIIYLIDNTIKTKKLEKEELEKKKEEPVVLDNKIPEEKIETTEVTAQPIEKEKDTKVEEPIVLEETKVEEVPASPVEEETIVETPVIQPEIDNIDELLNKDYSKNNEIVNKISDESVEEPIVKEEPKAETPKSKYNNDKKLSDIFGKKEIPAARKIETTQDFSDELDKILQKLNSEESKIEEENDYTNMF